MRIQPYKYTMLHDLLTVTAPPRQSLGLALDARNTVGRFVTRRFCALLEDGIVKLLYVEEGDGLGVTCSAACPMLSEVKVCAWEGRLK